MKVKDRRRQLFTLSVVVAAAASFGAATTLPVVQVAENWSQDLRVATLTTPEPQSEHIVIVTVTEDTLAALPYRSPLDRRFVSALLRTLEKKGARLIGIDLLLDQPSESEKDLELQETLRALSVPVVLASAETSDGLTEGQVAFMTSYLDGVSKGVPIISADSIDGTVRAVMLRREHEGRPQLSLIAVVADTLGFDVPAGNSLSLRLRGAPNAKTLPFATYPAHAVALLPDAWFAGRIVLIGADLHLVDRHRTAFSVAAVGNTGDMPGVFVQAHALSQVLEGNESPISPMWRSILVTVLFAFIGAVVVMFGIPDVIKATALLIAIGTVWAGGFVIFQYSGQLVPLVAPTLALVFAAAFTYAWRWREERMQRRFIHEAFSKFVAPAIVDHLIEDPGRLRLGGERRNITFLFTDIADYTVLSENTEATMLVNIMNEYLDGTCRIILDHGGTIMQIVGDALNVMFNAPLEQPDHPARAVDCALALDAYCQAFACRHRSQMIAFGVTRIGVNTGVTVVGNFGGEKRFDYSATGDAINTAARLESVNKYLGTRVCVSGTTVEGCHSVKFRPVGELVLKGKSESVSAYEPVPNGVKSHTSVDEYMAAYRLLSANDPKAKGAFRGLAKRYPEDALIDFHLKRLAAGESGNLVVMKEK